MSLRVNGGGEKGEKPQQEKKEREDRNDKLAMKNAAKKNYIFAWHKQEASFPVPKTSQINFQSYANLKVLPGGDPEREFEEGSFQFPAI